MKSKNKPFNKLQSKTHCLETINQTINLME